jgi:hypothetical protein
MRRIRIPLAAAPVVLALATVAVAVAVPTSAGAPTAAGNRSAAQASAAAMLPQLQLPSAAVSSPAEPAGDGGELNAPGHDEATPNLVDAHAF